MTTAEQRYRADQAAVREQAEIIVMQYLLGSKSTARAMFNVITERRKGLAAYHITNLFNKYNEPGAYDFFVSVFE